MKAFYFLPNYNAEQCLNTYSNQYLFSEIDETNLWCDPDRYSTLLGLLSAYTSIIVSATVLITALIGFTML